MANFLRLCLGSRDHEAPERHAVRFSDGHSVLFAKTPIAQNLIVNFIKFCRADEKVLNQLIDFSRVSLERYEENIAHIVQRFLDFILATIQQALGAHQLGDKFRNEKRRKRFVVGEQRSRPRAASRTMKGRRCSNISFKAARTASLWAR